MRKGLGPDKATTHTKNVRILPRENLTEVSTAGNRMTGGRFPRVFASAEFIPG
jgi:hypothetical protein